MEIWKKYMHAKGPNEKFEKITRGENFSVYSNQPLSAELMKRSQQTEVCLLGLLLLSIYCYWVLAWVTTYIVHIPVTAIDAKSFDA